MTDLSAAALPPEFWMVMDGRALLDIESAAVLEAFTERPSNRTLRKRWGNQDAVLVRCFDPVDGVYTKSEVVKVIR